MSTPSKCDHKWVTGDNQYVSNASVCLKCGLIAPTNAKPDARNGQQKNKPSGKLAKSGDKVIRRLCGAGVTTKEVATVLKVTKRGIWLDNGAGNDPSGPFDAVTGESLAPSVPGFRDSISKIRGQP